MSCKLLDQLCCKVTGSTCGRYTCVGGRVAQLALAAASAAFASAGKEIMRKRDESEGKGGERALIKHDCTIIVWDIHKINKANQS